MRKIEIIFVYSVIYLTFQCFDKNCCLPTIEITKGPVVADQPITKTDPKFNNKSTVDYVSEWEPTKECPQGSAHRMRHLNVAVPMTQANQSNDHDALQFDVICSDGIDTKYTVEIGLNETQPLVIKRFGYYKRSVQQREARVQFNLTELNELTNTLDSYNNSQTLAQNLFFKILDKMCDKLGFSSNLNDPELRYLSEHYCQKTVVLVSNYDKIYYLSKICLFFLLLISGLLILCLNCYLRHKNSSEDYCVLNEEQPTPTHPLPPPPPTVTAHHNGNISNGHVRGQTGERYRQWRTGAVSYNTFDIITKH